MSNFPDRIPYETWINSQLSIARHYGQIKLGGDLYVLDFDNCRSEGGKYFPDLVRQAAMRRTKNKKREAKSEAGQRTFSFDPQWAATDKARG